MTYSSPVSLPPRHSTRRSSPECDNNKKKAVKFSTRLSARVAPVYGFFAVQRYIRRARRSRAIRIYVTSERRELGSSVLLVRRNFSFQPGCASEFAFGRLRSGRARAESVQSRRLRRRRHRSPLVSAEPALGDERSGERRFTRVSPGIRKERERGERATPLRVSIMQ